MDMQKIEDELITRALDKGLDLFKEVLGKIVKPPAEELGLLLKDQITYFRTRNAVSIWMKWVNYCELHHINQKNIQLKLLVPILDNASLEEDEYLQDKWAILLGNLVDSEQNIEGNVFPYLLSQISTNEFSYMQEFVNQHLHNMKIDSHIATTTSKPAVDVSSLREFEVANLIRLALIQQPTIHDRLYVLKNPDSKGSEGATPKYRKVITELGLLFIMACNEKGN